MNTDLRHRLGKSLIFRYVDEPRRDEIIELADILEFSDGQTIIREGEVSAHIYLVVQGEVCVNVGEREGHPVYLSTIGEGEIFGEAGIFLKTARTANVDSLGSSRILRLHRSDLMDFIKRDPSTGIRVLMIIIYGLLRKLRESNQELAYERKGDSEQEDIDALVESLVRDVENPAR